MSEPQRPLIGMVLTPYYSNSNYFHRINNKCNTKQKKERKEKRDATNTQSRTRITTGMDSTAQKIKMEPLFYHL
jgi:hypothetical protein